MLLQYLVGLCCLRASPEAVDVILGDMVFDPAAEKKRDVDVTVKINDPTGAVFAFKAYEVKQEKKPLNVAAVEQLAMKLIDMHNVTHRGIVSASGFTKAAQIKAAKHRVDLYVIKPYELGTLGQFPELEKKGFAPGQMNTRKILLYWNSVEVHLVVPNALGSFSIVGSDNVYNADGSPHLIYSSFGHYREGLLLRSTEILISCEPTLSEANALSSLATSKSSPLASQPWRHAHTIQVRNDEVFIRVSDQLQQITDVTLTGYLQLREDLLGVDYYLMKRVSDNDIFAGGIVSAGIRPGTMQALVAVPHSTKLDIRLITLQDKHLNAIRSLRLDSL